MGVLHACQAVLPRMIERRSGKIIVLSGGGAAYARPNFSAYAASKAAVARLVETLAEEVRDKNIQVNCMAPGGAYTSMTDEILNAGERGRPEGDRRRAAGAPDGRRRAGQAGGAGDVPGVRQVEPHQREDDSRQRRLEEAARYQYAPGGVHAAARPQGMKGRVLVTGGAGFIGSHTVDLLLASGYEVRVLDSLQPRVHPQGKPEYLPAEVDFRQGEVENPADLLAALEGVDCVLHLAAYQDYMPDFSRFLHVNAESTALLYELILAHRLPVRKVVVAASQAVAGEGKYRCAEHGVIRPGPRPLEQLERGDWEVHCPHCGAARAAAHRRSYFQSAHGVRHIQVRGGDAGAQPGPALRRAVDQRALHLRARSAKLFL